MVMGDDQPEGMKDIVEITLKLPIDLIERI